MSSVNAARPARERGAKTLDNGLRVLEAIATRPDGSTIADLARVVDILAAAKYRGYVALEYEAAEDPLTAIPRHVDELKKLLHAPS